MHKIDYGEFFKTHDREKFEDEYLDIFKDKRCKKNAKFLQTYKEYNKNYKKFRRDNSLNKLPAELKDLFIASYKDLVDWFIDYNDFLKSNASATIFEVKNNKTKDSSKKKENDKKECPDIYGKFSEEIRSFFAKYADSLNLYSCAYCECAYTGAWKDDESQNEDNSGFFDLDHFFPKAEYPLFALCLYNFVPCCQICNSRIKGSNSFLEFYNIDIKDIAKAKEKLLRLSPVSTKYNFDKTVKIRYIPKLRNNEYWHYSPLSQSSSDNYEVFFDTEFSADTGCDDAYEIIISAMELNERYNSLAIKNKGLYLLDLKKRYPVSHIQMIDSWLAKSSYYTSPEEIEKAIFHKEEKNILLGKMRGDVLE